MEAPPTSNRSLIYWVRHGETGGNHERIFMDPMKATLTDRGRLQAKIVGEALSDVIFTRAYSSNLPRAVKTGEIILEQSKHCKSLDLSTDPRIREREHGEFEGRSYDEGNALRGKGIDENHSLFPYAHFYLKGTEDIMKIIDRAESFFKDLAKELKDSPSAETVLIVGHGYFTDLWMSHIALPNVDHKTTNYSKNLSLTLQNCGYHKFMLSGESEGDEGKEPSLCWEFLEIHKDDHLSSVGFACVRL